MKENRKIRELINKALEFYDKGEWNKAIELLNAASQKAIESADLEKLRETEMYLGWNYWKKGDKEKALDYWLSAIDYSSSLRSGLSHTYTYGTLVTQASAHAGLGIYYAEKGDRENTLRHAKLAQDLLPPNATINQAMNLNACAISLAKIGELDSAEEVLRKVMQINEQFEESDDPVIVKKAKHQLAKNWYNLASLIYIPLGKFQRAINGLTEGAIPRYVDVGAETDLAAAYHRVAEAFENLGKFSDALYWEELSLELWENHPDDPNRAETARQNIERIKENIEKLKQ